MYRTYVLNPVNMSVLALLALGFICSQFSVVQWRDLAAGIFAWMFYALVIGSFVLRIGLILFVVFAVYRVLRQCQPAH